MQVSFVAKLIISAPQSQKCEKCGRAFIWNINEDAFVWLPDGSMRVQCPHCGQKYRVDFNVEKIEGESK